MPLPCNLPWRCSPPIAWLSSRRQWSAAGFPLSPSGLLRRERFGEAMLVRGDDNYPTAKDSDPFPATKTHVISAGHPAVALRSARAPPPLSKCRRHR